MTEAEIKAYTAILGISQSQYDGMTPTSAADFLMACANAKTADLRAETLALEKQLLKLQIEAVSVHIAIDRAIAADQPKPWTLNVPATPPLA